VHTLPPDAWHLLLEHLDRASDNLAHSRLGIGREAIVDILVCPRLTGTGDPELDRIEK